ncbi:MAG TPA: alcohol dehydrogenase catalytic domain-containing protein [Kofleriaceae bacterium]|nr:alcohol dehydrogenase catalytic domain-containing protein [Kofleriaceae bacterium]
MSAERTPARRMKAAVYHGAHDVRIEDRPVPTRGDGQALLRVLRSGMCGTDATEWRSGPHLFAVDRPHPVSGHVGPLILGHEFVGEVVEVGAGSRFAVGDRVAAGAGVWCGACPRCAEGRTNLCWRYTTLGLNVDGGMAEFVAAPEQMLARLPDGLSVDVAALAQPLAVGLHAARRSGVADGDRVVLIGAGAIGTFVLAGVRSLAAAEVTVVDFPGPRLDRALRIGAARVVAAGDRAVADVLAEVGARGADVVIEASGAPGQLAAAIRMVRPGGTILQVGLPARPPEIDVHALVIREITIRTSLAHVFADDLAPALQLLATTELGRELVDSVHPLDDVAEQLERLAAGQLHGKVIFDPSSPPSRSDPP